MDELICRSVKGRTTATEEEALRAWRLESDSNAARYEELVLLLSEVDAALSAELVPPPPPLDVLLGEKVPEERPVARRSSGFWSRAGVIAAAAAAVILLLNLADLATPPPFSLQAGEFVTGPTETATAVLSDGTVVRLAPGSRLRIPEVAGSREVMLDGQAYFAVTEVPAHPFRVRTRAGEALVLGTRFEVRVANGDLRVIVLEGRVALEAGGRQVQVGAGEMSMVRDGATTAAVQVGDLDPLMAWLDRFLVFQATPLREAARELERAYGIPVIVTDSILARETVTGWYADRGFEEVLMFVCAVVRAHCSIGSANVTISPY
jgi:transmembrane sensor